VNSLVLYLGDKLTPSLPFTWPMDNSEFLSLCIASLGDCLTEMAKLEPWVTSPLNVASLKFETTTIPPDAPSEGDN
jgi:hypothetical protein